MPSPPLNNMVLQGVDAVIHIAGPVYHPYTTSEEIYCAAVGGTQALLDALNHSTVKRFVMTTSIAAFFKPDLSNIMDETVYEQYVSACPVMDDIDPKAHTPSYTYVACKAISDKQIWKAAEKFFHIDFILPPTLYGWFPEHYPTPKHVPELNGNKFLDVAKAHVRALTAPVLPKGEKKRLIIALGTMTWVEAIEFLKSPEVVAKFKERGHNILARLPETSAVIPQSQYSLDTSLTEHVLDMRKADYISWQDTLLEVIPNLMDWEKAHSEALL
ncbi:hypothetical protein D9757_010877 [Collybiopsis confluens]|uniref:3-beta hydroxysteroid dehydrogenase/isomerase domain-containing protein n=1 Tax=Collybiopsis confluens TaxID=2823264 RepID=A0A8H5M2P3_9AGAR|nr:hypothetical protein D9757_010877 [Collybiopsis confluens]